MITFRTINEHRFRGIGIGHTGTRELINAGFARESEWTWGISVNLSRAIPLHVGLCLGPFTVYVQIMGEQSC
jgi:hypothetical protein